MTKETQDSKAVLSTKQRFVEETYNLLAERGLENLRVRDIADRVGCTAAALYKHFDSMDHLVALAAVRFMDEYIEELVPITRYSSNALDIELQAWRCFNAHAFTNPPIYLHLFWNKTVNSTFGDIMAEYTLLFRRYIEEKGGADELTGYYYTALFEESMQKRDYIWLRKAANEGFMLLEDALYVSKVNDCIVHAMLQDHVQDYKQPGVYEQAVAECNELIERNIAEHCTKK